MEKHTPWKVGVTKLGDGGVYDANENCVCVLVDPNKADTVTAAFIVRAVNAHEEMLEALKKAYKLFGELRSKMDDGHWFADDLDRIGAVTHSAIAKAERGE